MADPMADVEEMLDRAREMPYGEARSILLEQALKAAAHDRELAFEVRLELTEAYQYGAEPAKSFATFSRSVAEYDADPGRWSDWHTYSLLWQFKWIAGDMRRFPEVPLQRAYDALAEMERRYAEAGYGLHAVHTQRTYVAQHVGDRAAAEEWFHKWQTTPRDDLSDCEGCDPSGKVWHLAWTGRDEEAIELAAPVVAGHLTCHVQPQGILSNLLLPYVRTGRLEEAAAAHLRAYRLVQGDANYVDDFGDHMEFCALTGNETRGLEILQRELPLLDRSPTPSDRMHFAGCAALLLRRLEDLGHGGLTVRREGADVPLERLRAELERDARDLAARFDARNGTGEQSRRLEARLAAEPLVDHLPLTPHARRVMIPVTPPVAPPAAASPAELLDLAEAAWRRSDLDTAFAAWERYDAVGGAPNGRRTDALGLAAAVQGDPEEARRLWERAAQRHAEAGDEVRRQTTLGRIGLLTQDLALVEETHRWLTAHGDESRRSGSLSRLAQAYAAAGRTDDAVAVLKDAREGTLLSLLAQLQADEPAAVETARAARQALRSEGDVLTLARTALLHGRLIQRHGGDLEELLGALGEVLAVAPRTEAGLRAVAHATRGEVLVMVDRAAEAAEDLIEAVALFTALGGQGDAALARVDLAGAYLATGRPMDAAVTAEEALALLDPDDLDNRTAAQWARANALGLLDDHEGALADFTALISLYRDPMQAARAADSAARVLDRLDRDAEAAETFLIAAGYYQAAGSPLEQGQALRRHALSLHWSGEGEKALVAADRAREVIGDDLLELGLLAYDSARILSGLERTAEAIDSAREAVAKLGEVCSPAAEDAKELLAWLED
ncbi:hypothetical protein GCM10010404_52700 [Nonomuraea africana]|uniref:Tetratricopeptide (TPR) repeat protein n=1 Tax=Nonomuraea africana TaxID=46171 RepID=A0ABR9KGG1_9ACTN|nr:hypothetical protein [Nonomuraea africana]MBE1561114.1 tetratricopeptide (TPR) repeat protein [Nonomuraea africana]